MTQSVAQTYGPQKVRANAIAPGIVDSPMLEQDAAAFGQEAIDEMIANVPLRVAGTSPEMANCALFLASDESSHVSGHTLVIDGGMSV
jgi:3-oxoacyl-[acyl-carrier protein] reductase